MEEKQIDPQESFQIISAMISRAKSKLADDGFMFIFWGWLVFAASLGSYLLLSVGFRYFYWTWVILMPLGGIVTAVVSARERKRDQTRTYVDSYLGQNWIVFGIALVITLVFMGVHGMKTTYFFIMLLYGIATFISGGLLSFRPLVIGSFFSFAAAIASVFFGTDSQFLWLAVSVLCSYIVPGHLLRVNYKSQRV